MIVCIEPQGKSFAGLTAYLTHDPEAQTADRVGWTHTHNLANDNVGAAVDEMLWTAREAEFLKAEAGLRAGGRKTEYPVKHVSLNWAPEEEPTREHMIETAEDFLRHMKWQDHQALFIAHEDKKYRHVHLMINAIHPETGLKLDDNFEYRRAQAWALDYEREHGMHCENRLKDENEREETPTRPAWMAFKEAENKFNEAEKSRIINEPSDDLMPENPKSIFDKEWSALKCLQRDERNSFFENGKSEFKNTRNKIFREIREEHRERWADYFDCKKLGVDDAELKEIKAALVKEQTDILETRRDAACKTLLDERKDYYKELLSDQKDMRGELTQRQGAGLRSLELMHIFQLDMADYRSARAENTTERQVEPVADRAERVSDDDRAVPHASNENTAGFRSSGDMAGNLADGFVSMAGGLLFVLTGGDGSKPQATQKAPEPIGPDLFKLAAEDAAARAAREAQLDEQRRKSEEWSRSQQ